MPTEDEDEHLGYDGYVYGWLALRDDGEEILRVAELNIDGTPSYTGTKIERAHKDARAVVRWKRGVLGPAEFTYPHPQRWTFKYSTPATPLPRLTTKVLTEIVATKEEGDAPPSAHDAWESVLSETGIPWHHVWHKVCHPLLTRSDTKNVFTILHRRVWNPEQCRCPLCDVGEDRLSHIVECPYTRAVFARLFHDDELTTAFCVLGLRQLKLPLQGLEAMLHSLAWKYIYSAVIQGRLRGSPPPRERDTAHNTIILARRRLQAGAARLRHEALRRLSRGEPPDPGMLDKHSSRITPAYFDKSYNPALPEEIRKRLKEACE